MVSGDTCRTASMPSTSPWQVWQRTPASTWRWCVKNTWSGSRWTRTHSIAYPSSSRWRSSWISAVTAGFFSSSFTNLWQPWQRAMDGMPATGPRSA